MKKYYWTCRDCGANLDPNEKCDCQNEKNEPNGGQPTRLIQYQSADTNSRLKLIAL